MGLLERYEAGAFEDVYRQLKTEPKNAEAGAVAAATMRRVRRAAEQLVERWQEHGFELHEPIGEPGAAKSLVAAFEREHGALPLALREFYLQLGFLEFVEEPPDDEWPELEHFDPLQVFALDRFDEPDDEQLLICHDQLHKFDISGVGPLYVELPATGFDPVICFEGSPLHDYTFVSYLRVTMLERGGIGPAAGDDIDEKLVARLTKGLERF
jgi:hypothetical protein